MGNIQTENLDYAANGTQLNGYLASPPGSDGPNPGVIVIHEWWGLNDYIRSRANRLAELGYSALAIDMYGNGKTARPSRRGRGIDERRLK